MSALYWKRVMDVWCSVLALGLLSPVLLVVAGLVRWKLGAPVLFSQLRVGLDGRLFVLHKFRSMAMLRDGHGELLCDAARLCRFGTFLRATSLDELPEFWNVLRGEMSLVGPRPLLPEYLPLYSPRQARRHEVKPGLTGWAQVNGRNTVDWTQRFEYDLWYVEHWNLWLDVRILLRTGFKVLKREGVTSADGVTPAPFRGEGEAQERAP